MLWVRVWESPPRSSEGLEDEDVNPGEKGFKDWSSCSEAITYSFPNTDRSGDQEQEGW
jgi:hypothetical protein